MNVMQLLLKKYRRKINKVIKGGGILSILFALMISLAIPPFNIFANSQNTIIVPTWDSSTTQSQWDTHLTIENYCEGTTAATNSCKLMFTVDSNYYGYIYFDGYSGNTKWMDFKMVFIADGYGEYNYNLWSNGQISINRVNIAIVNLVRPDTTVDLSQIIQLLTAIEQDTSSIDILVNQTKTQIINVLNQLVLSNSYLDLLTKMRQWHMPVESYGYVSDMLSLHQSENVFTYNYYDYPVVRLTNGDSLVRTGQSANKFYVIIGSNRWFSTSNFNTLTSCNYTLDSITLLNAGFFNIFKFEFSRPSSNLQFEWNWISSADLLMIPIFFNNSTQRLSTDFALNYGFTNPLLDNLNIIANGTNQSNQSSSDLNNQTSSFENTSNNLYTSENAFNTDMNNKLQSIDTSFNPSTSFGSKFLSSANWVRTQFDNLTSTSPFGTVLSFSMLLGLSLLIIGKVFK